MGFENFSIKLVNYTGFFSPGQTLVGTVHITNTKVENFTGKCLANQYKTSEFHYLHRMQVLN